MPYLAVVNIPSGETLVMRSLWLTCLFGITFLLPLSAQSATLYDKYPWALTYYYGQTVSAPLIGVLHADWRRWPEHLQSLEIARTLNEENIVRRFFNPIVGVVQLGANGAVRYGKNESTIYEIDPCIIFRWANLPWNHYVNTSFAIAEGISYDTSYAYIEKNQNTNAKRLLNYLMLEASFAPPTYPQLQLVARIHHRSGAYGLYHAGNTGSNVVGLGLRYLFA
jgi:hypothetical protein